MKIISVRNVESFAQKIRPRPSIKNKKIVESIISQVQKQGDTALKRYEKKFGGVTLSSLRVTVYKNFFYLLSISRFLSFHPKFFS